MEYFALFIFFSCLVKCSSYSLDMIPLPDEVFRFFSLFVWLFSPHPFSRVFQRRKVFNIEEVQFIDFLFTFYGIYFFVCVASIFWFTFNWRVIALQYCVGLCRTSAWISHRCTYVLSPLKPPPTSHPIPYSRLSQIVLQWTWGYIYLFQLWFSQGT